MMKPLLAAALLCSFMPAAQAGVISKTNIHYFTVSGASARAIYHSLESRSEPVNAGRTLASTDYTVDPQVVKSRGPGCHVSAINVVATYDINLPRLANEAALSPGLRQDWRSFVAYLRGHEYRHRSLWMACIARFNSDLRGLVNGGCDNIDARVDARWAAAEQTCRRQNDDFNAYAEHAVRAQPFMRRMMSGNWP